MILHFFLFIAMVVSLIIVPGPDMLYVVGRSITRGRMAAWYAALGIATGYVIFTLLVAAGIGILFKIYPQIFSLIKYAGLLYLCYLAYRIFRSDGEIRLDDGDLQISPQSDFVLGLLTSLLNPKGILFYLQFCRSSL